MLENLRRMTNTLTHRGSEQVGYWVDSDAGIALGQRRLAILEPSTEGQQPMASIDQRYQLVMDGRIYNHQALRYQLTKMGYTHWRGASDTETLLAAISQWGLRRALQACVGMFALAVWDKHTHRLTLARDRLGEKPLYYGWINNYFLFGSELKALRAHKKWQADINREALACQLRHSYIPAPLSIYNGIYKLVPGQMLQISSTSRPGSTPRLDNYWALPEHLPHNTLLPDYRTTHHDHLHNLEGLLRHSVRQQMQADVPIGAFLSNSVGSALLTALMQNQSALPIKTFAIGYEQQLNSLKTARNIAAHLGTQHTDYLLSAPDITQIVPQLPQVFDEPFANPAQIPSLILARLAKSQVDVSLGDVGADVLFAGYERYVHAPHVWKYLHHVPQFVRNGLSQHLSRWQPMATFLKAKSSDDLYRHWLSHWKSPEDVVIGVQHTPNMMPIPLPTLNTSERMMYMDSLDYLPNNSLANLDRSSMYYGLETRNPFLDHRLVEMAWRLPLDLKLHHGNNQCILRQLLRHYLPTPICAALSSEPRPPLAQWLRTCLKDWAEHLLNRNRLQQEGFLDPDGIQQKWHEHLSGQRNWQYDLWNVLMFQAWHEQQFSLPTAVAA